MNVFVKFVGQDGNNSSYLKCFKADGELETTDKLDEAINLNNNYWSFETIIPRCNMIANWFNPLAYKAVFFDMYTIARIGTQYIKEIVIDQGEYSLTFTSDEKKAFANYTDEVDAFSLRKLKELFPCMEIERIVTYLTLEEISEKV